MSLSMYQISIPVFERALGNLTAILNKAAAHAETKKIDPSVLINLRLAPDMFALARQVQIVSDTVKGCAARLAGVDIPSYADTETSFHELQERIAKTVAFIKSLKPEQINGTEEKTITLKLGPKEVQFSGFAYLTGFVLPNLYFHETTTYAILRSNGVDLGKMDFLGSI